MSNLTARALAGFVRSLLASMLLLCAPVSGYAQDGGTDDPWPAHRRGSPGPPPAADQGLFEEPDFLTRGIRFAVDKFGDGGGREKRGWYPELSNMITGSGFISLGPGYRHYLFHDRAFIDASTATSWHLYKMAQMRFEVGNVAHDHLTVGTQVMWQDNTQINYFGIGADTIEDDRSQYRLKSTDIVGYGIYRPSDALSIGAKAGWLNRLELSSPAGTFRPTLPDAQQQFPLDPGMQLEEQPEYLHGEASVTADTRDYPGHPTGGGLYRAAFVAYSDRDAGTFRFNQYEAEAMHFIPLAGPNWIFAFHAWTVFTDVSDGHDVPFYFLPSLGGHSTLRAYSSFRFHDHNLALLSGESRWAVFTHVDAAVFAEGGNVARRFADLDLDKTSVGAGIRLHTQRTTWARVDVAHGAEGWKFMMRTSDAFRLSRLARRTLAVPFVP